MSTTNNNSNHKSWLQLILQQMGAYSLSIIFIVIVYLMLWIVPQINDLIMVLNQAETAWIVVPIFFTILSVFAFLISTLNGYINPKIPEYLTSKLNEEQIASFHKEKQSLFRTPEDEKEVFLKLKNSDDNSISDDDYEEDSKQYIARMFPKVLATILILITAFAVNNTFEKVYGGDLIFLGNAGLLVFIGILFLILNKKVADFLLRIFNPILQFKYFPLIIAIICIGVITIFGFFNQGGSERDIRFFFYSLLLLALFFLIVTTSYNKYILGLKKYAAYVITVMTILILLAYLFLFISPASLKMVTPLSIVLICVVGVYTILNGIRFLSARYKRFPSLPFFLIILAVLAVRTTSKENFHHYEASHVETTIDVDSRLGLNEYITEWIANRKNDILNSTEDNPFPIILVSSEGGGSRAGLWTFLVQSYLFDKNPDYFKKYLFSLSGASGGGVGNNMFYTQAYELSKNSNATSLTFPAGSEEPFEYRASKIYNGDYLSSSVASLLGRDSFVSITGIFSKSFPDRGAILEFEWEKAFAKAFKRKEDESLGAAYLQMMPQKANYEYIRPLLVTSVTQLQTGQRFIISPVDMKKDSFNMDVFPDLLYKYPNKDQMIKRSTAMSLNARFPYLSPVGRVTKVGQFGDAGYYNNIGGSVSLRLEAALTRELAKDSTLTGKYSIRQLAVTNYVPPTKEIAYSSQLTAPLNMFLSAGFAHPKESEKSFNNRYSIQSKLTKIANQDGDSITPFIPLGRYLSLTAVKSMEARLNEIKKDIDKVIEK